jgi:hypothetical protein
MEKFQRARAVIIQPVDGAGYAIKSHPKNPNEIDEDGDSGANVNCR